MNVIHIATIQDAILVNQVAEILGKGPNSLSVLLQDKIGNNYLGCHSSAWTEDDFSAFQERVFRELCTQEQMEALDRLYESSSPESHNYIPTDHWGAKLLEWGLYPVEV